MRFARPKKRTRLLLLSGLVLALACIVVGAGLAKAGGPSWPDPLGVYSDGFSGLGLAGLAAFPFAAAFALLLILGEQKRVNRRILSQRFRNRQNMIEAARVLAIALGGASVIIGCLGALDALLAPTSAHLDLSPTLALAGGGILAGLAAYGVGRFGR